MFKKMFLDFEELLLSHVEFKSIFKSLISHGKLVMEVLKVLIVRVSHIVTFFKLVQSNRIILVKKLNMKLNKLF